MNWERASDADVREGMRRGFDGARAEGYQRGLTAAEVKDSTRKFLQPRKVYCPLTGKLSHFDV